MKLKRKNKSTENKLLRYSITDYHSLESFIKNIHYIRQGDFKEEAIAVREILDLFIINEEFNQARDFFINDILGVQNENKLKALIAMLYVLKIKYFDKLEIIIFLQELLTYVLIYEFGSKTRFDQRLNTGALSIRNFLDLRYKDLFKKVVDENWIDKYKTLIHSTINSLSKICSFIIEEVNMSNNIKKLYLESYLGELNQVLDYNRTLTKYDFSENLNEKIKELKINIIEEGKKSLIKTKIKFLFLILYKIDILKLPKDFFEIVYKIYSLGEISSELNNPINPLDFNDLEWLTYDSFKGGAQTIPWFNYDKYRLLIFFHNYLRGNKKKIEINNLSNDNFMGSISDIEKELNNFTIDFIGKFFVFNENDFNLFRKDFLKEIEFRKKEIKDLKENYIQTSNPEEKYITQFKEDCSNVWNKKQEEISEIFDLKEVKEKKDNFFFGQNKLLPKEWFLEIFDKHVGMSRDFGEDYGRIQSMSKYRKILEDVNSEFDKSKGDKEIRIKDLYNDLVKNIEDNKIYYLFYTGKEIYNIPDIQWDRTGSFIAKLKIKNSVVFFSHSNIKDVLLLEKKSFNLKQYLDKNNNPLLIEIIGRFIDKEIKQIIETNENIKSKKELQKYVKLKILEKFEVERKKGFKMMRLII